MEDLSPAKPGLKTKLFWALLGSMVIAVGIGAWLESGSSADLLLPLSGVLMVISGIRSPIPLNVSFRQWNRARTKGDDPDYGLNMIAFILLGVAVLLRLMGNP